MPAYSGVASAHADEVSFRVGRGESVDYVGPAAHVAGRDDSVLVRAGQWIIEFQPQPGKAFTCGTYHGTASGDPGGNARVDIAAPGLGCVDAVLKAYRAEGSRLNEIGRGIDLVDVP